MTTKEQIIGFVVPLANELGRPEMVIHLQCQQVAKAYGIQWTDNNFTEQEIEVITEGVRSKYIK